MDLPYRSSCWDCDWPEATGARKRFKAVQSTQLKGSTLPSATELDASGNGEDKGVDAMLKNWAVQTPRNSTISKCSAPALEGGSLTPRHTTRKPAGCIREPNSRFIAERTSGVLDSWPLTYTSSVAPVGTAESAWAKKVLTGSRQSVANRRAYMAQTHWHYTHPGSRAVGGGTDGILLPFSLLQSPIRVTLFKTHLDVSFVPSL